MRLKIVQVGEPVLRQRARPLLQEEIALPETQQLIVWMHETMRDAPGVGWRRLKSVCRSNSR